ncbi:MAG: ferredoxin family protein [Flavobacteriales bacterium]|nr:ferredoxin family protein [Flavobacteriales bacterium]
MRKGKRKSAEVRDKMNKAKESGRFEPVSLHPYIDLNRCSCIGSGACVRAYPEQDILWLINGKATVINATACIGHGTCFHACPVEAISVRIGTEKRGVDLPHVKPDYETNVPGIYIAGELGGMGLIKNSAEQGIQAVRTAHNNRPEQSEVEVDLAIVGAGPAGIAAALEAKCLGMKAVILEQGSLGGTVFTFPQQKVVMTRPMDLPLYGPVKLVNTGKHELLDIWTDAIEKHNIEVRERHKVDAIHRAAGAYT